MNETIYKTFLDSTIKIGDAERQLIQKNPFFQEITSTHNYFRLSRAEKANVSNARSVLLNKADGLSIRDVKQLVSDVFRHCPHVLFVDTMYLSEFLLLADLRVIAIVMTHLGKRKISQYWDTTSCIQTMHRSSSFYYFIPSVIKEEDEFVLKTLDCVESPLTLPEYCSILTLKTNSQAFAIQCLRMNVAAYGHFSPKVVENFDVLLELVSEGFLRKSLLVTEASIYLDIISYLKFTLSETYKRDAYHVVEYFKNQVNEKLDKNMCINLSCHRICQHLLKADVVSPQNIFPTKFVIKEKLCLFLDTNTNESYQKKLELCCEAILIAS